MGKCFHTTVVKASIDQVWPELSNFHNLDWAAPVIESLEKVGDKGAAEVGAQRKLNGVIEETLRALDNENHTFTYTIDEGPAPIDSGNVSKYTGHVECLPVTAGEGTIIKWTSEFETKDDGAVGEFCNPIYEAFMGRLQERFGA